MLYDGLIINKIMSFIRPDLGSLKSLLIVFGREHCPYKTLDIYYDPKYDTIDVPSGIKSKKTMTRKDKTWTSAMSGPDYTIYTFRHDKYLFSSPHKEPETLLMYCDRRNCVSYFNNVTGPVITLEQDNLMIAVSLYSMNIYMELRNDYYFIDLQDSHHKPRENRMFDSFGHHHFIILGEHGQMTDLNRQFIMSTEHR